jgi:hypothetical protein
MFSRNESVPRTIDLVPTWLLALIKWVPHLNAGVMLALLLFILELSLSKGAQ